MSEVKLSIACPQCGAILRYSPERAGRLAACQGCGTKTMLDPLPVPPESPPEPPPATRPDHSDELLYQVIQANVYLRQISGNTGCLLFALVTLLILLVLGGITIHSSISPRPY